MRSRLVILKEYSSCMCGSSFFFLSEVNDELYVFLSTLVGEGSLFLWVLELIIEQ